MTQSVILNSSVSDIDPTIYYIVDDRKTLSRNQALLWAGGDIDRIYFYFMDQVWDNADWPNPPTESFKDLCDQRCRNLRQRYDWLCLWLSSGYDSQTILNSFIRSGVRIDEIAFMDRTTYHADLEIPFIVESAKTYQKFHNPKLRITPVEIDYKYTVDLYQQLGENWILEPGATLRFSNSTASNIQRFNNQVVRSKLSTPGRRADIYGKEKPRLDLMNGHWYMRITDHSMADNINSDTVYFYISADMPELHIKQCHMVIDWFESLPNISHELVHEIQSHATQYYMQWNIAGGRDLVPNLNSRYGKDKLSFRQDDLSPDSLKLLKYVHSDQTKVYHIYQGAKSNLENSVGTNIGKPCLSKPHLIRPFKQVL